MKKDDIWLVIMLKKDRNINGGIRLSQAFDNQTAAQEYRDSKLASDEEFDRVDVMYRGVYSENK